MNIPRLTAAIAGATCLTLSAPVSSAEFCVSCADPDAHYACTYDGVTADPSDSRLQLYCITELAKAGKHASCSVDRAQKAPCAGEQKKLATPGGYDLAPPPAAQLPTQGEAPAAEAPPEATAADPASPAPPVAETKIPKTEQPPKTVQEMVEKSAAGKTIQKGNDTVGDAAKATGSALQKAGQAVGTAAKKTWTCITSLFGNC